MAAARLRSSRWPRRSCSPPLGEVAEQFEDVEVVRGELVGAAEVGGRLLELVDAQVEQPAIGPGGRLFGDESDGPRQRLLDEPIDVRVQPPPSRPGKGDGAIFLVPHRAGLRQQDAVARGQSQKPTPTPTSKSRTAARRRRAGSPRGRGASWGTPTQKGKVEGKNRERSAPSPRGCQPRGLRPPKRTRAVHDGRIYDRNNEDFLPITRADVVPSSVANVIDRRSRGASRRHSAVFLALSSPGFANGGLRRPRHAMPGRLGAAACKPGVDCPPTTPAPCRGPKQLAGTPDAADRLARVPPRPADGRRVRRACFAVAARVRGRGPARPHLESHLVHRVRPPDPPPRGREQPEL